MTTWYTLLTCCWTATRQDTLALAAEKPKLSETLNQCEAVVLKMVRCFEAFHTVKNKGPSAGQILDCAVQWVKEIWDQGDTEQKQSILINNVCIMKSHHFKIDWNSRTRNIFDVPNQRNMSPNTTVT